MGLEAAGFGGAGLAAIPGPRPSASRGQRHGLVPISAPRVKTACRCALAPRCVTHEAGDLRRRSGAGVPVHGDAKSPVLLQPASVAAGKVRWCVTPASSSLFSQRKKNSSVGRHNILRLRRRLKVPSPAKRSAASAPPSGNAAFFSFLIWRICAIHTSRRKLMDRLIAAAPELRPSPADSATQFD